MAGFDLWLQEKGHFPQRSGQPARSSVQRKEHEEEGTQIQVRCSAQGPLLLGEVGRGRPLLPSTGRRCLRYKRPAKVTPSPPPKV